MVALAVVGSISSGKSTVLRMLAELGATTRSADDLAKELTAVGQPALKRIYADLGRRFRRVDGSLDRAALGQHIFRDARARELLEAILHPIILGRIDSWLQEQRDRTDATAVGAVEVLRLPEALDAVRHFDVVWLCRAPAGVRMQRLMLRDGIRETEAANRLAVQQAQGVESCCPDLVLDTGGTRGELRRQVARGWSALTDARNAE